MILDNYILVINQMSYSGTLNISSFTR